MTSVVKQIETAIVAALEAELELAARVTGFRSSVLAGMVKTEGNVGLPEVFVKVSNASGDNYGSPVLEFDVQLNVKLEWGDDPTIATFDEVAAKVEALLIRWNNRGDMDPLSTAVSTENFRCDGCKLSGGPDAFYGDGSRPIIATTFNFAVVGVYQTTNETEALNG